MINFNLGSVRADWTGRRRCICTYDAARIDAAVLLLRASVEYVSIYYTRIHNPPGIVYLCLHGRNNCETFYMLRYTYASNGYRWLYIWPNAKD